MFIFSNHIFFYYSFLSAQCHDSYQKLKVNFKEELLQGESNKFSAFLLKEGDSLFNGAQPFILSMTSMTLFHFEFCQ